MAVLRFVFCAGSSRWSERQPVFSFFKLEVPESISFNKDEARRWAYELNSKKHSSDGICYTEDDIVRSSAVAAIFNSCDWAAVSGGWFNQPTTASDALDYVKKLGRKVEEVEHLIGQDAASSMSYACDILRQRFPLGEDAIAAHPQSALRYAQMFGRFKECEPYMAGVEYMAEKYGELMREKNLWGEWTEEEVMRSPVWLFQYAKDYMKGSLTETLHQAMQMFSFNNPNNPLIKRYFTVKRYKYRKRRKPKNVNNV